MQKIIDNLNSLCNFKEIRLKYLHVNSPFWTMEFKYTLGNCVIEASFMIDMDDVALGYGSDTVLVFYNEPTPKSNMTHDDALEFIFREMKRFAKEVKN